MIETATTRKGRETRARLLESARQDLIERGTFEVAAVASRSGDAPSVVYRYFDSKDGLVEAVVRDFYEEYDRTVFQARAFGGTWLEQEAERIRCEVAFICAHPLGRVVAAGLLHEPAATRVDAARQRDYARIGARNIRHAQRTGELPKGIDGGIAAAAVMGALRAILAEALGRRQPPAAATVAKTVIMVGRALLRVETRQP